MSTLDVMHVIKFTRLSPSWKWGSTFAYTYAAHNIHLYLLKWWVNPSLELCSEQCWRPHHSPVAAGVKGENGITLGATQNQYSALFFLLTQHNTTSMHSHLDLRLTIQPFYLQHIPHITCTTVEHVQGTVYATCICTVVVCILCVTCIMLDGL